MTQITINDSLKVSFIVYKSIQANVNATLSLLSFNSSYADVDPSISAIFETAEKIAPEVVFTVNCKDIEEAAFLKQLVKRFV